MVALPKSRSSLSAAVACRLIPARRPGSRSSESGNAVSMGCVSRAATSRRIPRRWTIIVFLDEAPRLRLSSSEMICSRVARGHLHALLRAFHSEMFDAPLSTVQRQPGSRVQGARSGGIAWQAPPAGVTIISRIPDKKSGPLFSEEPEDVDTGTGRWSHRAKQVCFPGYHGIMRCR